MSGYHCKKHCWYGDMPCSLCDAEPIDEEMIISAIHRLKQTGWFGLASEVELLHKLYTLTREPPTNEGEQ